MFLDTKHAVDRLTEHLLDSGVRAAALHGGKSQPQRTRTLAQFKTGHVTVLVATNVAARGIHVDNLDLVVNVDPPSDHKDYLHRGGRTARAGESGSVVTLVLPNQRREMTRLMADAGITPQTTQVRSGEAELSRITGAQAPSGVPVTISRAGRRTLPAQRRLVPRPPQPHVPGPARRPVRARRRPADLRRQQRRGVSPFTYRSPLRHRARSLSSHLPPGPLGPPLLISVRQHALCHRPLPVRPHQERGDRVDEGRQARTPHG